MIEKVINIIYRKMTMENKFYTRAACYWAKVPATIDGVLGGFGHISDIDIVGSRDFLNKIKELDKHPDSKLALDCGAGIGRVTKNLLIPQFEKVDLVEQDEKFINTAKQLIGEDNANLGTVYKIGLQNFKPQKRYDVIWCQWVLGHLNDYDLIGFLERCREALNENGIIIVKENITTYNELEYDDDDSSVTRSCNLMIRIFKEAQLDIVLTDIQANLPADLYPVYMFALIPMQKIL
ncbi:N-terminal Xaa-Pro-Lys N-methyltransferase 1-B-like [Galleria mellonella]|uniref:Alpha N-terminal protein methyltransferase 1 n=1 Tax=Galleria mellonella TaxID=7137 RepID=A0A6J3C1V1_GALME|nr:N-terminal Xaa-Pro-Lys N-methyltransferase 1-B-like [Galleria mellonella]